VSATVDTTQIRWSDDEAHALDVGAVRLAGLLGRPCTRVELIKLLVRAWAAEMRPESMVEGKMENGK
jgi:hypothetical protein